MFSWHDCGIMEFCEFEAPWICWFVNWFPCWDLRLKAYLSVTSRCNVSLFPVYHHIFSWLSIFPRTGYFPAGGCWIFLFKDSEDFLAMVSPWLSFIMMLSSCFCLGVILTFLISWWSSNMFVNCVMSGSFCWFHTFIVV